MAADLVILSKRARLTYPWGPKPPFLARNVAGPLLYGPRAGVARKRLRGEETGPPKTPKNSEKNGVDPPNLEASKYAFWLRLNFSPRELG